MNERQKNQLAADQIRGEFRYNGTTFAGGEFVALLDGEVVAVERTIDEALAALRGKDPDPARGMLVEVSSPQTDIVRR